MKSKMDVAIKTYGGRDGETGSLWALLRHQGVTAPHTGEPYSEASLFGIGGGVGMVYWAMDHCGGHYLGLGTRFSTKEAEKPLFVMSICDRIGAKTRLVTASSPAAGRKKLIAELDAGNTPIVWAHRGDLPYFAEPTYSQTYHTLLVSHIDDAGTAHVADISNKRLSVTLDDLDHARRTTWSPKFRMMIVEPPTKKPDVKKGFLTGLRACHEMNTSEKSIKNVGLTGLQKWADLLTDSKDKKGWPSFFPRGEQLYYGLTSTYTQIESRGFGGSANRELFADFLSEAAPVIGRTDLEKAADQFRGSAKAWGKLAKNALPAAVPLLKEARNLLAKRMKLFRTKGMKGLDDMSAIQRRLDEISGDARRDFPMSDDAIEKHFAKLRKDVLAILEIERCGFQLLGEAL